MDVRLKRQKAFEQELYWAVADLLHFEVDLLFFNAPSTYFETETAPHLSLLHRPGSGAHR